MERPPGSLDDLQPQDLTTSSLPSVIDLTRKGEECVLDAASLDAITMVSHPGWYPNSGTSNTGLPFPETGPSNVQPGDHIQPDNAFSQTTVTVSYMSRSHAFSTHDSLSGHSSLYSVPSVSKHSLQPSCDSENGLRETGITLNQHYLDGPIDLAAQTELSQSLSQAQLGFEDNTQQTLEFNGAVISNLEMHPDAKEEHNSENSESLHNGKGDIWSSSRECPKPLQECHENSESLPECTYPLRKPSEPLRECPESLHEGVQRCPGSLQVCQDLLRKAFLECPKTLQKCPATLPECPEPLQDHSKPFRMSPTPSREHSDSLQEFFKPLPECTKPFQKRPTPDTKEPEDMDSPEVLVLCSTQNSAVVPGNDGARELFSLNRGSISTLEDPMSPSATSLDDVEDVFILPEASSSPSGDNSLLETDEGAFDGLSAQETLQPGSTTEDSTPSLHSNDISKRVSKRKAPLEPLIDLTEDVCMTDVLEDNLKGTTVIPHMNGNAKALQRTLTERKLPVRSSRGMRLEAIVMNINSSRYKVSGCIRTSRKSNTFQKLDKDSKTRVHQNDRLSESKKKSKDKVKPKASPKKGQTNVNPENCKNSTSDSDVLPLKSHSSTVQLEPDNSLQSSPVRSKRKSYSEQTSQLIQENSVDSEPLPQTDNSLEINVARIPSSLQLSKSPHKNPGKAKSKVSSKKARPTAKTKRKKRRKKVMRGQASNMFSPKEPEIKLKYINYKEEKRDLRIDNFSPFIRVESKESALSLCTVVNYPEEVCTQPKKSQQQGASGEFISAVVPSTSCLQLGRLSTRGEHQRALVCCLCGQSANAMDLGDLHGPYYSEGYRPSTETPAGAPGLKEDDSSDSDSSSCSSRGQGRKRAIPPTQWTHNTHRKSQQWMGENSRSSAAKRVRPDPCGADVEDWYSPPVLPLEPCEYWLHEDCGVWSAGVYLIKGKVYGLEEAVKAAQVMMCSSCHERGAMLGCFFKGCRKKYHYRCALQSDCVLIKDNLSMKCKKHKNKSIAATQNSRWVDR